MIAGAKFGIIVKIGGTINVRSGKVTFKLIIYFTGIHPIRITDGFELAAQAANENLDKIADKFDLDPNNPENLIQTAMVSLFSEMRFQSYSRISQPKCYYTILF